MILRGIEWKAMQLRAESELTSRKPLDEENLEQVDILNRDWF